MRLAELIENKQHPILLETQKQLSEYFEGQRKIFDLPLNFEGTEFQQKVWQALLTIPFGETRSYKDIAEQIGNVKAFVQSVLLMVRIRFRLLPCHRVVGANGKLVGFAGGLENKGDVLLKLEFNK